MTSSDLVTQFADGTCATFVYARVEDSISVFGDAFLRRIYAIYNQTSWVITMALVRYTDEVELVPLPEGGFWISSPTDYEKLVYQEFLKVMIFRARTLGLSLRV